MNVLTDSMDNMLATAASSVRAAKTDDRSFANSQVAGDITLPELLARCIRRPIDISAWQEFALRYQSTIRQSIETTLIFKHQSGAIARHLCNDEVVDRVIQMVYYKLVENRCEALKALDGTLLDSMKSYLVILSINAVQEYFQGVRAS